MAGFQQAANALTGAYGAVAQKVGIYNELVGKNKELIEKTQAQNEELDKKNKELTKKNKEITEVYTALNETRSDAQLELDALHQKEYETKMKRKQTIDAKKEHEKMIERRASIIDREWERNASHMSKNMMTTALFGDLSSGSGGGI